MTSISKQKSKWVNGIDSIRFFLALIVFLSHLHNPYVDILKSHHSKIDFFLGQLIAPIFSGTSAVIAFFIISGFVIHYPNKNKPLNVKNFLIRRLLRIGIPLIVIGGIASYCNVYSRIPVWSLYCELIYYTIYPILIRIKVSWKAKFWISFAVATIIILVFAHDDLLALVSQKDDKIIGQYWQFGLPLTWLVGLPCWLLGVLLAESFDAKQKEVSKMRLWSFRIFVFCCSVGTQILRFKFCISMLFSENIFAFLLFFWLSNELVYYQRNKSIAFLEHLGKFSYSLYLCHELFVMLIAQFMALSVKTYPIYILLTIGGSYFAYLLVEYPSHKLAQLLTSKKSLKI